MSMIKKDFIALADAIKKENRSVGINQEAVFDGLAIECLADFCENQNRAFKRERWLSYIAGTCGPCGGRVKAKKEVAHA